jgi:hypothetical protein
MRAVVVLALAAIVALPTAAYAQDFRTITIDGNPSDWAGISPAVTDPNDGLPLPGFEGWDIVSVSVANDSTNIYFLVEFTDASVAAVTDPVTEFSFDLDSNSQTGCVGNFGDALGTSALLGIERTAGVSRTISGFNFIYAWSDCGSVGNSLGIPVSAMVGGYLEVSIPLDLLPLTSPDGSLDFNVVSHAEASGKAHYVLASAPCAGPPSSLSTFSDEPWVYADLANQQPSTCRLNVDIQLSNRLTGLWLGVEKKKTKKAPGFSSSPEVQSMESNWSEVDLIPPCRFASIFDRYCDSGTATWRGSFADPGELQFVVTVTPESLLMTLNDLLLTISSAPLTVSQALALSHQLGKVKSIHDATRCLTDSKVGSGILRFACATSAISNLTTEFRQQRQIIAILAKFGINKSVPALLGAVAGFPLKLVQSGIEVGLSFDIFLATTATNVNSGAATVSVRAF